MDSDALAFLQKFMGEMKKWEEEFSAAQDHADENDLDLEPLKVKFKDRLSDLLARCSTSDGLNRERLIDLGSTIPVTYDPERDVIEQDASSDSVFIVTQAVGFKSIFRFQLICRGGSWVIEKKQRANAKGDWIASSL